MNEFQILAVIPEERVYEFDRFLKAYKIPFEVLISGPDDPQDLNGPEGWNVIAQQTMFD